MPDSGTTMTTKRILGFALSTLFLLPLFSSVSSAQLRNRQPLLRWGGHGFSDGYHVCTPGPNPDYYNPYSAHNSQLYQKTYYPLYFKEKTPPQLPSKVRKDYPVPEPVLEFSTYPGSINQPASRFAPFTEPRNQPPMRRATPAGFPSVRPSGSWNQGTRTQESQPHTLQNQPTQRQQVAPRTTRRFPLLLGKRESR